MAPRAYIGTSGWNYKHWRHLIYPPKFAQKNWLSFIADRLDTVEVNTSFYRIPTPETITAWQESTPERFKFAMKMWRGITHYKKLTNAGEFTQRFLDVADGLKPPRRAPLLIQLPPNQHKDLDKLDEYLRELKHLITTRWDVALEFRHDSWLNTDVYRLLDKHRAALCIHDMPGKASVDEPNDVHFIYIRRHGTSEGLYSGSYSGEELEREATRIRQWVKEGRSVYAYFNNDIGGHAFRNAEQLRSMIEGK